MNGLPEAFLNRMQKQLGDELPAFLYAMDKKPVRGIRFNPLKPEGFTVYPQRDERIPWEETGWYYAENEAPGVTIWHEAGAFYLQDPAAMIPVNILNPQPGEHILDLCAAPGGKSTQIGAAMRGEGLLVCNEPVPKRAQILSRNLERMGIRNAAAVCALPDALADKWPEGFDAVLADVPCSGEGMFRRDPAARDEWSEEQAAGCAARQREIMRAAARLVRPGGRMVYSTCTFNPAENEENVAWFLREHPEWEAEAFRLPEIDGKDGMFTCFPHRTRGEGQFAALLRRKGEGKADIPSGTSIPAPGKAEREAVRSILPEMPEPTHILGNTMVYMPECPDLKGIRVFRLGLHLAEIRGKHPVPDHAAAYTAAGHMQRTAISPEEALRYMAGEPVPGTVKGWTVVCCNGMPLGWGKGSNGIIKNHYPKGLWNGRLTGPGTKMEGDIYE